MKLYKNLTEWMFGIHSFTDSSALFYGLAKGKLHRLA